MNKFILALTGFLFTTSAVAADIKINFSDLQIDAAQGQQQTLDLEGQIKAQQPNIAYKSLNISQVTAVVKSGVGGGTVFLLQGDEVMGSRAINSDPAKLNDKSEASFEQAAMKTMGFKAGTKLKLVLRGNMVLRAVILSTDAEGGVIRPAPAPPVVKPPPVTVKPSPQPPTPPAATYPAPVFRANAEVIVSGGYWAKIKSINESQKMVEVVYLSFPGLHAYRFDEVFVSNGCVQSICVGDYVAAGGNTRGTVAAVNSSSGVWVEFSQGMALYEAQNLRVLKKKQ